MTAPLEACVCGLEGLAVAGPRHVYLNSSTACWAAFGEVLGREYTTPALLLVHQLSVDARAAQHPGGRHPDKSVASHLVGLHLVLERSVPPVDMPRRHKHLADSVRARPRFQPPTDLAAVRAIDVAPARSLEAHAAAVRAWAAAVWRAWSGQHGTIADFARASEVDAAGAEPASGSRRRR